MYGYLYHFIKCETQDWCWWLTFVVLATWEAEIRRIMFQANQAEKLHGLETILPK
jgi:hypothetical protein